MNSEKNAFDEDIRTIWSAKTGDKGEFVTIDLETVSQINAVQVNFAEQDATAKGRLEKTFQQYVLEISDDGKTYLRRDFFDFNFSASSGIQPQRLLPSTAT